MKPFLYVVLKNSGMVTLAFSDIYRHIKKLNEFELKLSKF